jgi:hypothetical protein
MAKLRGPSKRVVLNRAAVTDLGLAVADGILEVGQQIIAAARPPDSPDPPFPTGQGLPLQGGVLVYVDGQKVAGWHQRGKQPRKPRAAKTPKGAIVGIVGYGFPGRFAETGTANSPAQPFLSPATDQVTPAIPGHLRTGVRKRLGSRP